MAVAFVVVQVYFSARPRNEDSRLPVSDQIEPEITIGILTQPGKGDVNDGPTEV